MRPPRLISLGMCAQDAIYRVSSIPDRPVKVLATHYRECGGGMAANAAVAAARLGASVQYWGRTGDDALGRRITDELAAEGVDITHVRRVSDCVSPSAAILVDPQGERLVCAYNDPALDDNADWLPLEIIESVDAVLADVRWPKGARVVLDAARRAGKIALLDADVGPADDLRDLVTRASHVAFSAAGLTLCANGEPGAALRKIAPLTRAFVGVTLGAEGFLWLDQDGEHHIQGMQVRALDTLAAGDVWHAAFAVALTQRCEMADAVRFANAAAAIKCSRSGGRQGAPTHAEVDNALVNYSI
ncbi:MAG: PfkB family carbohydrate kinase [Casimicrobiaceae bacterium]